MFLITCIVNHCHFNCNIAFFVMTFTIYGGRYQWSTVGSFINCLYKFNDTAFTVELFRIGFTVIIRLTKIIQGYGNLSIEISQFSQSSFKDIFVVYSCSENTSIRPKLNTGSGCVGSSYFTNRILGNACSIFLFKCFTLAVNSHMQFSTQSIYTTHPYSMQTTGNFIRTFVKFSSGM